LRGDKGKGGKKSGRTSSCLRDVRSRKGTRNNVRRRRSQKDQKKPAGKMNCTIPTRGCCKYCYEKKGTTYQGAPRNKKEKNGTARGYNTGKEGKV